MHLINEVDTLAFDLECAIDNLWAVHTSMEEDQGANWQKSANAVCSAILRLIDIKKSIQEAVRVEVEKQEVVCNTGGAA